MFLRHENGCVLAFQATLPTYFHLHLPQKNHEINTRLRSLFLGKSTKNQQYLFPTQESRSPEGILAKANFMVILLQQTGNCSNVLSKCTLDRQILLPQCPIGKERKSNANFYYTVFLQSHCGQHGRFVLVIKGIFIDTIIDTFFMYLVFSLQRVCSIPPGK